jgi:hypothetical protein
MLSTLRSSLTSQFQELESEKQSIIGQFLLEQQKTANLERKIADLEKELKKKCILKEDEQRTQAKKIELEKKMNDNISENVNFLKEKANYERIIGELRERLRDFEEKEKKNSVQGLKENKKIVEMKLKRK